MTILVQQRQNLVVLTFQNTKFSLNLHYNCDESYLYLNKAEICKFKAQDNVPWCEFCLDSITKDFTKDEIK